MKGFSGRVLRIFFGLALTVLALFFLKNQHAQFSAVIVIIRGAKVWPLLLAGMATFGYVLAQGLTLRYSYAILGQKVPLYACIKLFLRRFWLSPFVPGGFSVAQYTMNDYLEEYGVEARQSIIASTLYVLISSVGFLFFLIPGLIFGNIDTGQLTARSLLTMRLAVIVVGLVLALLVIFRKTHLFQLAWRKTLESLNEVRQAVKRPGLIVLGLTAVVITETMSLLTLWLGLIALGIHLHFSAVIVVYTAGMLLITVSPIFQGVVLVETTLAALLTQFDIDVSTAIGAVLLYRFFQLWLIFIVASFGYVGSFVHNLLKPFSPLSK